MILTRAAVLGMLLASYAAAEPACSYTKLTLEDFGEEAFASIEYIEESGKAESAFAEVRALSTVLLRYYDNAGRFPNESEGLRALWRNGNGNRISKKRKEAWTKNYVYSSPNEQSFKLCWLGSDKAEGGTRENADICCTNEKRQ